MYILTIYKKGKRKMKNNSLKKTFSFLVAMIAAGSVMTSSINPAHAKTISSHKSILVGQTITVKVKKGKKQKSSNRKIATVSKKYTKKKKRVTVRKKGKKIRKWKKVKVPNGKFAIRGIRAGHATITIKSGRKTYKFKVTVKNRPASKTSSSSKPSASSSSSSYLVTTNPRPAGMTVPNEPVVSEFRIDRMKNQDEFYNTLEESGEGSTVIIRWKTNLKSRDFILYNETTNEIATGDSFMARKRYNRTIDDDFCTSVKTDDGYAFPVSEKKAGKYKYFVAVYNQDNDYRIEKIGYAPSFTVTFKDYKTAEDKALKDLISRSGAESKSTVKEKLVTLANYMATKGWENGSFIHPGKAYPGEYADTYGDDGVWFQSRVITCVWATGIIQECASIFGVPDSGIDAEYPYPADSPYAHHVRPVITYNGETFRVDGSPWTHIKPWTDIK
jgi:hypothetical protein